MLAALYRFLSRKDLDGPGCATAAGYSSGVDTATFLRKNGIP
jgi:hypothetical protein